MSDKSYGSYHIKTFGCQMNHSDSERIASFLESNDFVLAEKAENADLVIINTCGVRQAAENRVYSLVNNLRKNSDQRTKDNRLIIITGCIAHRKDVQRRLRDKVNLFFPINDFKEFENFIIENCLKIENWSLKIPEQDNITNKESIDYLSINPKYSNNYEAFVPIMTGCNNFCAYCVVPYARGREVSRPADEILTEVNTLISSGYKHIVLLGQNVNSYKSPVHKVYKVHNVHKEKTKEIDFAKLLKKINSIPGKFWVSFVSSHPKDMSDELIEAVAKCKKVCEWIHLPVQAGNDEVLRRMNRNYTSKHYLGLVRKINRAFKKHKPETPYAITTDVIVGFPGETRTQFADSALVMEKAKYDMVYFGQYSPRPGTVAWKMKDNVSKKEKERRENVLNEILKKTIFANNKKYVGKVVEVLIEKRRAREVEPPIGGSTSTLRQFIYFGKTRTMKNIKITTNKKIPVGSFMKVKVAKANVWNLEGEIK